MTMGYDPDLHLRWTKQVAFGFHDECWLWAGAVARSKKSPAYRWGVISVRGQARKAVRVGWSLLFGPIPDHKMLLHTCDNSMCVNPGHVYVGTQADNVRDMDAKGRRRTKAVFGERHHNSRLTADKVVEIRLSSAPTSALVARYGVSQVTVDKIRRGAARRNS